MNSVLRVWWYTHSPHWWTRFIARYGDWEYEHEWKTCPTGERWCPHAHWKREKK